MEQKTISHLKEGSTLQNGKYTIRRMIGAGGFGCTYEVASGDNRYCVKEFFMSQSCTRDDGTVRIIHTAQTDVVNRSKKKFLEEATVLRMMQHPGIVHVVDIFEEHGTAYFVMDYIEGQSLQAIVDSKGPISEDMAISYMTQVANALDFVHQHNRLHLDIKPDNIMIDGYGRAILIDFGASKYIDQDGESTSSAVFQTPGYAPLEQVNGDVSMFGPFTDIYGLGATFYKVLSGLTPVSSPLRADGADLTPLPDEVSPKTREAVMAALRLNRRKRPQSAKEFIRMIESDSFGQTDEEEYVTVAPDEVEEIEVVAEEASAEAADGGKDCIMASSSSKISSPKNKASSSSAQSIAIVATVTIVVILLIILLALSW